jgi:hypothetical protein
MLLCSSETKEEGLTRWLLWVTIVRCMLESFSKEKFTKNVKKVVEVGVDIAVIAASIGCAGFGNESPSEISKDLKPITTYPATPAEGIDFEYQLVQAAKEQKAPSVKINDLVNNPENYSGKSIETEGFSFWEFTGASQNENTLSENYRLQADTSPKSKFIWLEQLVETSRATIIVPKDTPHFNGKLKFRGTVQELKDQNNKIVFSIKLNEVISFEKSDMIIAPVKIK